MILLRCLWRNVLLLLLLSFHKVEELFLAEGVVLDLLRIWMWLMARVFEATLIIHCIVGTYWRVLTKLHLLLHVVLLGSHIACAVCIREIEHLEAIDSFSALWRLLVKHTIRTSHRMLDVRVHLVRCVVLHGREHPRVNVLHLLVQHLFNWVVAILLFLYYLSDASIALVSGVIVLSLILRISADVLIDTLHQIIEVILVDFQVLIMLFLLLLLLRLWLLRLLRSLLQTTFGPSPM